MHQFCLFVRVRTIYEDFCDFSVTTAMLSDVELSPVVLTYFFYMYPFEYIEVVE